MSEPSSVKPEEKKIPTPEERENRSKQAAKLPTDQLMGGGAAGGEAHESEHEALQAATGIRDLPAPGLSRFEVATAELNARRGEGISRAQEIRYSDSAGNILHGGQYTKSDGTYFKTSNGDTYRVELVRNESGAMYSLEPTRSGIQSFEATRFELAPMLGGATIPRPVDTQSRPQQPPQNRPETPARTDALNPKDSKPPANFSLEQSSENLTGAAFYKLYRDTLSGDPARRIEVAGFYTRIPADQRQQFQNEVLLAAQRDNPEVAMRTIAAMREDFTKIAQSAKDKLASGDVSQGKGAGFDKGHNPTDSGVAINQTSVFVPGMGMVNRTFGAGREFQLDARFSDQIQRFAGFSDARMMPGFFGGQSAERYSSHGFVEMTPSPGRFQDAGDSSRAQHLALDTGDPQTRQFLMDVLKYVQAALANDKQLSLNDLLHGRDSARSEQLRSFLLQGLDRNANPIVNEAMIARLAGAFIARAERQDSRKDLYGSEMSAVERMTALFSGSKNLARLAHMRDTRSFLAELTEMISAANRQLQLDGTERAFSLSSFVRGTVERQRYTDSFQRDERERSEGAIFNTRFVPGQESMIKAMLENRLGSSFRQESGNVDTRSAVFDEVGLRSFKDGAINVAGGTEYDGIPFEEYDLPSEEDAEQDDAQDAIYRAMLAARNLDEQQEQEEREREEEERRRKEEEEQQQQQQQNQEDEDTRRRRYIVKEGDTLQNIAARQVRDVRLAPLIYEINKNVLTKINTDGKEVISMEVGLAIWLPSTIEVKEFRARLFAGTTIPAEERPLAHASPEEELAARFGVGWSGLNASPKPGADLMSDALEATKVRRTNIEKVLGPIAVPNDAVSEPDDRIRYVVRLGDTLTSVALKHPALQDVSLWRLLANVNQLSEESDERGTPTVKLHRGQLLFLPKLEEVEEFRRERGVPTSKPPSEKLCHHCGKANLIGSSFCSGCATPFSLDTSKPADAGSVILEAAGFMSSSSPQPDEMLDSNSESASDIFEYDDDGSDEHFVEDESGEEPVEPIIELLSTKCRIARLDSLRTPQNFDYSIRLEVLVNGNWRPLVSYEIYDDYSWKHIYDLRGQRTTDRLNVSLMEAHQRANEDVYSNWEEYVFLYEQGTER